MNDEFIDCIKQLKPAHQKDAIKNIFSWKEFESLINLRPFVSSSRLIFTDATKEERVSWPWQAWLSDVNTFPATLLEKFIKNNMGYLIDCSRVNNKINNICEQLDTLTGYSTDAHIYFSIVENNISNHGFGIHKDTSHNLIVQIEGKTRIEIWNIESESDVTTLNNLDELPVIDTILNSGDIVYIPKNYWHRATSQTKRLSISFPSAVGVPKKMCQDRTWLNIEELIK